MAERDDWFKIFHAYKRLSDAGMVQPLLCPDCDYRLIIAADDNDELILTCYVCDTTVKPGIKLYDQVRAVVMEHNDI